MRVAVGDEVLLRAMRAHANFAEYVLLALLLLFFAESSDASAAFVHVAGAALVVGRLSHAWGVGQAARTTASALSAWA